MAFLKPVLDRLNPARAVKRIDREPETQETLDQKTENLTLYHFRTCPFCLRVRRSIDRLALNIETKDINRDHAARKELITGGGRSTVPCLRIDTEEGSIWLYESTDIIRFLNKVSATA